MEQLMTPRRLAVLSLISWSVIAATGYAQTSSDAGRDKYEKFADVLAALEVSTASRIDDIGAGDGFYSVRIAPAMPPSGRVTALEVSEKALVGLRERLEREGVKNVDVTLGAFDDPKLPAGTSTRRSFTTRITRWPITVRC
jgi:predicted O-methyltransferase YrrM